MRNAYDIAFIERSKALTRINLDVVRNLGKNAGNCVNCGRNCHCCHEHDKREMLNDEIRYVHESLRLAPHLLNMAGQQDHATRRTFSAIHVMSLLKGKRV